MPTSKMPLSSARKLHSIARTTLASSLLMLSLTGCAGFMAAPANTTIIGPALQGTVHGGQQPVTGAALTLYAASNAGYGARTTNLLTSIVTTDTSGNFSITSKYTCTAGQQMYIVSTGGNAGSGVNNSAVEMAALGDCSNLSGSTFIFINEVTTVGSVFALSPFMAGSTGLGAAAANAPGLARAFASVKKVVNVTTGSAPGPSLPARATAPSAEINSLANSLAACINSSGPMGGTTPCDKLFALATPAGGNAPTDTLAATVAIAQNPTLNVTAIYNLAAGTAAPFGPTLSVAPADWTMSINYATAGLSAPQSTTLDAGGNVWIANSGNNTITVLAQTGQPVSGSPFSGNSLNAPAAIAIDMSGNALVANKGASSLSAFTASGGILPGSPFTGGGLSNPTALAVDAAGDIWVANASNTILTELTATGVPLRQLNSGSSAATAIAIDSK